MSDNKRYYWLKLKNDFFDSRKMKKLRKVAGGDTYTIIYLKLQLLSIDNEGLIEFEGTDEDIYQQLSLDIDEEIDDIKMTLAFCNANNLIEYVDDDVYLSEVPALIGSETASTRRSRKHRKKQKELQSNKKALQSNGQALQCNTGATKRNTEIDIEIDKEIESRDRDKKSMNSSQINQIINLWNSLDGNIPKITALNTGTKRYKLLNARINEYGIDDVIKAIKNIRQSRFLQGYVNDFAITFDWFVRPNNFVKVLEGNYTDKQSQEPKRGQEHRSSYQSTLSESELRKFEELKKEVGL